MCPPGYYCPMAIAIACPAGSYCEGFGNSSPRCVSQVLTTHCRLSPHVNCRSLVQSLLVWDGFSPCCVHQVLFATQAEVHCQLLVAREVSSVCSVPRRATLLLLHRWTLHNPKHFIALTSQSLVLLLLIAWTASSTTLLRREIS